MAIPKKLFLLSSVTVSWYTFRHAPHLTLSESFISNSAALLFLQLLGSFCWAAYVYPLFLSPLRNLPQPPGGSIVFGHFLEIFRSPPGETHRKWVNSVPNDGLVYYRSIFNQPRVLFTSPKALAEVLVQKSYGFAKPAPIRKTLGKMIGLGLVLAEGDQHKRQRKLLLPAFSFRHVEDLYPVFWNKSVEMTDAITKNIQNDPSESKTVDMHEWATRATLDIIGVAGMDQDFNAIQDPNSQLAQTYRIIFSTSEGGRLSNLTKHLVPKWLTWIISPKRYAEYEEALATIRRVTHNLIRSKRVELEKGNKTGFDIISVAIGSGGFSDEELVNQMMTFLAAGHETTASSMTWATYLLCKYPEAQNKVREELLASRSAITNPALPLTSKEIARLPYLNAVLNETLRLFPSIPLSMRESESDQIIQGQLIPKGTTIIICAWAVNTSKALWGDDALDFVPERWLGPGKMNNGGAVSNYANVTFSHGPKSCIGKDFARAEFACLMAAFISRFEIEIADETPKVHGGFISASPVGGMRVKLTPVTLTPVVGSSEAGN